MVTDNDDEAERGDMMRPLRRAASGSSLGPGEGSSVGSLGAPLTPPINKNTIAADGIASSPGGGSTASSSGTPRTLTSTSSRLLKRCTSSFLDTSEELPSNVSSEDQLCLLPPECLSGDPARPLRHVDEWDQVSHYSLHPMLYSVLFILSVELLERFCFYGINYTQTAYLTGAYNEDWNANMNAVSASTYVSISTAAAFTTPFLGAYLADSLLGHYWGILVGALVFYLPGLLLIALTTIPGCLGNEFNRSALVMGFLVLWPMGTGTVKSIVNVFGARQFHPLLQSSLIESYYVKFYMCINVGALVGGFVIPVVAQHSIVYAYFIPMAMLSLAVFFFAVGTPRYVRNRTHKLPPASQTNAVGFTNTPQSINLSLIFRITVLIVPFNVAYSQMATAFIVQGTVMRRAFGFVDAAFMNNVDAGAVIFFGMFISAKFYPWLQNRGIRIPTSYKFAIGSALGVLAIAWALLVEWLIHRQYNLTGRKISVLWQAGSYVLLGLGEIFAVSSAYEAAFNASPPDKKAVGSAINLFSFGCIPNVICIFLYNVCQSWFRNSKGTMNLTKLEDYATAHVARYFWVLLLIAAGGVIVNVLPAVRKFVESIEERAADLLRTPQPATPRRKKAAIAAAAKLAADERIRLLLPAKRHEAYLKYGSTAQLYRQGSMRAGPSLSHKHPDKERHVKKNTISRLYKGSDSILPAGKNGRNRNQAGDA